MMYFGDVLVVNYIGWNIGKCKLWVKVYNNSENLVFGNISFLVYSWLKNDY